MEANQGAVNMPPFSRKEKKSRKKLIAVFLAVFLVATYASLTWYRNILGSLLDQTEDFSEKQGSQQSNLGVNLKPGGGTIVYEEFNLSEPWELQLDIPEKTFIQIDIHSDQPVNLRMFSPFNSGSYVTEFSQQGWIGVGSFTQTLTITPETQAKGTIMITELGRL